MSDVLTHDVLDGRLPEPYRDVDVIYTEPPWPNQTPSWGALVAKIVKEAERLRVPLVMALPRDRAYAVPADAVASGVILRYGVVCVFCSCGVRAGGGTSHSVLRRLAEWFDCLGDPCCGSGTTGRIAAVHGKRSVLSDIRPTA